MTTLPNTGRSAGAPGLGEPGEPPPPPGRLGAPIEVGEARLYLEALTGWRDRLRAALGDLDARARGATAGRRGPVPAGGVDAVKVAADVTLAFAMWQAVAGRTEEMLRLYDNGRMGRAEAEQLSVLIWGRLDGTATGGGLPVSFAEACTLALSLTETVAAEVTAADVAGAALARLEHLRVRTEAVQRSAGAGLLDRAHALALSLSDVVGRATAGSDVGTEIDALNAALEVLEADVAAAAAHAATMSSLAAALPARLRAAAEHAGSLHALAQRCNDKIAVPPRLGIPDPAALGPPPVATRLLTPEEELALRTYDQRLARVEAALCQARARYEAPLTERDDLRGLLRSYQAKAAVLGVAEHPRLVAAYDAARRVLWTAPCDLAAARALTGAYVALVPTGTTATAPGTADDEPVGADPATEDVPTGRPQPDQASNEEG